VGGDGSGKGVGEGMEKGGVSNTPRPSGTPLIEGTLAGGGEGRCGEF